jgi:hypothetical protein
MTIDRLRTRLTVFWLVVLAFALVSVGGLIYALLARALYTRIDDNLRAALQVTATSLANDLDEGQDVEDAARSTAAELSSRQHLVAIFDEHGRLLAEGGRDSDLQLAVGPADRLPEQEPMLDTVTEARDDDDRHRLATQRIAIARAGVTYLVVVGTPLESTDEELESLREIVGYVIPLALVLAGFGGWVLARKGWRPSR